MFHTIIIPEVGTSFMNIEEADEVVMLCKEIRDKNSHISIAVLTFYRYSYLSFTYSLSQLGSSIIDLYIPSLC